MGKSAANTIVCESKTCYYKHKIRCECGKLLAESDGEYLIIKCRGCKKYHRIRLADIIDDDIINGDHH